MCEQLAEAVVKKYILFVLTLSRHIYGLITTNSLFALLTAVCKAISAQNICIQISEGIATIEQILNNFTESTRS